MKHIITILLLVILHFNAKQIFAQGAYINIQAGYGMPMSSGNIEGFINFQNLSNAETYEQINVSMGKGLSVGGAFGYMFTKNMGAELGISYLVGGMSESMSTDNNDFTFTSSLRANMLRINPTLVIASGLKRINPYAKMGVIIGAGSIHNHLDENDNGDIASGHIKMNGGIAFGVNGSVGILCAVNKKISLFGEINTVNMSYAPTKGEITEYIYNGVDELASLVTNEKEFDYEKTITEFSNTPPVASQPEKRLRISYPFGSIGIQVGCRVSF